MTYTQAYCPKCPKIYLKELGHECKDGVEVLTVYTPRRADTYLLKDWLANPDEAIPIKSRCYDRPPLVRMQYINLEGEK